MYWPLGAPIVYNSHVNAAPTVNDGDESDSDEENRSHRSIKQHEQKSEGKKDDSEQDDAVLDIQVARNGHFFATITSKSTTLWQIASVVALADVERSDESIEKYGDNVSLLIRPDCSVLIVSTSAGFFITYNIKIDSSVRVNQIQEENVHISRLSKEDRLVHGEEKYGFASGHIRFRMVIQVDAGIVQGLALDDELVVATRKPCAMQCIKWSPSESGDQTSTEIVARMPWLTDNVNVIDMVYDRAMNLAVWVLNDGKACAAQRIRSSSKTDTPTSRRLFRGYVFHQNDSDKSFARKTAINARFSLLAIACIDCAIIVYTAKDYAGNIPFSHHIDPPASTSTTGQISCMVYSPDGYALFVGFENGWALWSVYGKLQASSFMSDESITTKNDDLWLTGINKAVWINSATSIILTRPHDSRLWVLPLSKSAVPGNFNPANIARTILHTDSRLLVFRGYDTPLSITFSSDDPTLWQHIGVPLSYLSKHQPLRSVAISMDGRYIAIAGRRGLAHYSMSSRRWKTFTSSFAEDSFVVRGGLCWYQHILVAACDTDTHHELRFYSREKDLAEESAIFVQDLPAAVVTLSITGEDSLLVYTYENILYHFVIVPNEDVGIKLLHMGRVALSGIVRAPARVRALSWILPRHQIVSGEAAGDIRLAVLLFLVDAKLVLLHPRAPGSSSSKYEMRIIANNVEYFDLMRNRITIEAPSSPSQISATLTDLAIVNDGDAVGNLPDHSVRSTLDLPLADSLWYFNGKDMHVWLETEQIVKASLSRNTPVPVTIPSDFYPTGIISNRALIFGLDADLLQRRNHPFAVFRTGVRSQLLLPATLRHYLNMDNQSKGKSLALDLAQMCSPLPYFAHMLEVVLHEVLDDEVDQAKSQRTKLPLKSEHNQVTPPLCVTELSTLLSFLALFPTHYLTIIVQCARKTEFQSWPTLFSLLPPPETLFQQSLEEGSLQTAAGFLLIMQTLQEEGSSLHDNLSSSPITTKGGQELNNSKDGGPGETSLSRQCTALFKEALKAQDWTLCADMARFLTNLDSSDGKLLDHALEECGIDLEEVLAVKDDEEEEEKEQRANEEEDS